MQQNKIDCYEGINLPEDSDETITVSTDGVQKCYITILAENVNEDVFVLGFVAECGKEMGYGYKIQDCAPASPLGSSETEEYTLCADLECDCHTEQVTSTSSRRKLGGIKPPAGTTVKCLTDDDYLTKVECSSYEVATQSIFGAIQAANVECNHCEPAELAVCCGDCEPTCPDEWKYFYYGQPGDCKKKNDRRCGDCHTQGKDEVDIPKTVWWECRDKIIHKVHYLDNKCNSIGLRVMIVEFKASSNEWKVVEGGNACNAGDDQRGCKEAEICYDTCKHYVSMPYVC